MNSHTQALFKAVIKAFNEDDTFTAKSLVEKILLESNENYDAVFELGINLTKLHRYQAALIVFQCLQIYSPSDIKVLFNLGIIYTIHGNYQSALDVYDAAAKIQPDDVEILLNKASIYGDLNKHTDALNVLDNAIEIKPDFALAWSNKGVSFSRLGRTQEALDSYNTATNLDPHFYEAWSNKSVPLLKLKRLDEALAASNTAITINPDYAEGWSNKGNVLHELKRYDEAITHYDRALSLNPDYAEGWSNKGNVLHELKRYDEAITHYDRALSLNPDYAEGWSNKGNVLHELKRYDEAITHYDRALSLNPDYAEGWSNKGNVLHELKRYDEAITHYDRALSLNPDYAEGWSNKGNVLHELKRYDEAITHYDRALSLNPDYAEGWSNKGNVLHELKRYDEAITHYDRALSLNPDIELLYGDFLHTKMRVCDWSNFDDLLRELTSKLAKNPSASNPFPLLALVDDPSLHKTIAENYSKKNPTKPLLEVNHKRSRNKKIRIGYYSADFRNHPVAFLIAGLIEAHDESQFEVFLFSYLNATDEMNARLRKACTKFIDIQTLSDEQAVAFSRELNIDIAIDLTGFTQCARPLIFSYRAAPVQVSYLGYPGTMGSNNYDYIIADNTVIPESSKRHYSEKIVWLPHTYQANDSKRLIGSRFFTREELGLPKKGFIFCCFNNNFKILPPIFDSWMRILNAVEGSSLWLFEDNKYAHANLKLQAEIRGINPSRLIFAERLDLPEHLARHRSADLFLDTIPYNAHTTASDALWSGLPVLTLIGQSFPARVAASLLYAIGLPELVTHSLEEYETLAIRLAKNPDEMAVIKEKLTANRSTMALFDTPLFTKNIEAAYIKMYGRYKENLLPDHIDLT